jgi:predicted AAA+ superfamily ATPase
MIASSPEFITVLRHYNPWWRGSSPADLPTWRRPVFDYIFRWMQSPPAPRALLLSGARQVGKTTLFLQVIQALIEDGVGAEKILYATFDHPLLKSLGLDGLIKLWREFEPETDGIEYLFLDEIHTVTDWQTWLKLQVDFEKKRRIAVTGSATPLVTEGQESGVGRWHTLRIFTLSFYEYLHLKQIDIPAPPALDSLAELFDWSPEQFARVGADSAPMVAHFHEYLLRGGFPQTALMNSITAAQKLLREDIVDKVLKRDMTALFGVRRVLEIEQVFVYLCLHGGGIMDMQMLCRNLELKKPTVNNFINLMEAAHLIYKVPPFGYGKEILRARYKIYLADPAIAPSVLLTAATLLEDPTALGAAVETTCFKHAFARYYPVRVGFSYWRGRKDREVDIVAEVRGEVIPFEVKYRARNTGIADLKGLAEFCTARNVSHGYVITRDSADFSIVSPPLKVESTRGLEPVRWARIPAPLACYWLGKTELDE